MLTSNQIRIGFIDFFKSKNHEFVPSSPIVPVGDETLLFANAGMNQFKNIFLGLTTPKCRRAANSQKCLRVSGKHNDLEEVGKDTYHHTFFEMLGNWSFNDYFKAEAIEWAWELLTKVWEIPPNKLWVTVFTGDKEDGLPKDEQASQLWTKVTSIHHERVLAFGKKDNFWEMGTAGPCGPCSEIHIDLGQEHCDKQHIKGHSCTVNGGCARFIELWNLVFIQYNRGEDGKLNPLGANYVDTGAGLERIVAVLQNKKSNYDTDLFMPTINATSDMTGHKYTSMLGSMTDNAFRVISDHIRALSMAITDGAMPSNEGRGYVIRRILRRASRFGRQLDMHEPFLYKLVPVVADCLGTAFPEVKQRIDLVSTVVKSEEESFGRTLDRGIEIFNDAADKAQKSKNKTITGDDAFQLYDTYGFPIDLTGLMAEERNLKIDIKKFNELMEQQRQRARAAQKTVTVIAVDEKLPVTDDSPKYAGSTCDAKIVGWIEQSSFKTAGSIAADSEVGLILDRTCFYAESGGQVGDSGIIQTEAAKFAVEDTAKIGDCVVHMGKVAEGTFTVGDKVKAIVSPDRDATRKNHTATHLLQWALQQVVGKSVAQQGSLVTPEYLRFDFTCPAALTSEQIEKVEQLVRRKIVDDLPVTCTILPRKEAEKLGAMALFGEKYGEDIRVVAVGAENEKHLMQAFSREFCGGTHVDNTGFIGDFKIIKEESISAGVRRITAITGSALADFLHKRSDIIDQLLTTLKVSQDDLSRKVAQLLEDNKKLTKQLKSASRQQATDIMVEAKQMLEKCEKIGDSSVVINQLSNVSVEQAREAIDMIKKKAKSAAVVFGFAQDNNVTLIAGVTDDLVAKGLKAGDIVKQIAPIVDGGGGGRPQMAQAGGKTPAKIPDALDKAREIIKSQLAG